MCKETALLSHVNAEKTDGSIGECASKAEEVRIRTSERLFGVGCNVRGVPQIHKAISR